MLLPLKEAEKKVDEFFSKLHVLFEKDELVSFERYFKRTYIEHVHYLLERSLHCQESVLEGLEKEQDFTNNNAEAQVKRFVAEKKKMTENGN